MAAYTPDSRSKGVRLAKRSKAVTDWKLSSYISLTNVNAAAYDQELIHDIINETPILHVSFNAPPKDGPQFPTILPMLGSIDTFSGDEDAHVYLHGSSVARLFRLTQGDEIPLCIAGTILDGYVLALAPFHNSCNYRSAVVFGYGSMVTDDAEKEFALRSITNNSNPTRWENSRSPPTKAELTSTGVLKVRIETASAKTRTGGPSDDKADLENPEVADKTWIGVVPTYLSLGEPIEGEHNKVKQVPEYLADWVADANSINEQKAIDAIES
jgi:nitroimidazol reductase NimA-like FMN-containing flavoprotein (pyridoxamine 5'-phosphate oxidase superfamily)